MNFTLKIWRQKDAKSKGAFESYKVENISADTSFLEMLDILNNNLIHEGKEPVAFDHDCREGICGMCSLHIDYAVNYSNIQLVAEDPADYQKELVDEFEQFTDLVNAANAIVDDTDARYEAFAKAEAYMINNSLAVPCYYDVRWCLTHVNEYTKINAMFGPCNFKYVNWETSEDAYTTAQYEEFAKAFDAAKS